MFRKGLAVAVILLFIGVALAPSINASVVKDELVEFDVEFCGLGKKHTVQLTQTEYAELNVLISNIENDLTCVKSQDERIEILKQGFLKFDKYNLFGGIDVRKAIDLTTNRLVPIISQNNFIKNRGIFEDYSNVLCILYGGLSHYYEALPIRCLFILLFLEQLKERAYESGFDNIGQVIYNITGIVYNYFRYQPINFMSIYAFPYSPPFGKGTGVDITTFGLKGIALHTENIAIFGFTGIKIYEPEGELDHHLFGTALWTIGY